LVKDQQRILDEKLSSAKQNCTELITAILSHHLVTMATLSMNKCFQMNKQAAR
jgi:hypothetical protein